MGDNRPFRGLFIGDCLRCYCNWWADFTSIENDKFCRFNAIVDATMYLTNPFIIEVSDVVWGTHSVLAPPVG